MNDTPLVPRALHEGEPMTMFRVSGAVTAATGIGYYTMRNTPRGSMSVSDARQIVMFLCYRLLPAKERSYPRIARFLKRSDHTSVLHACRKLQGIVDGGRRETALYDDLETTCRILGLTLKQLRTPKENAGLVPEIGADTSVTTN